MRTVDDPDIKTNKAVLPSTERIINKARKIKIGTEELRLLKNEYQEIQEKLGYVKVKQIKMLPQILEEEDIYEEVKKIKNKAHSLQGDSDIDSLDEEDYKINENFTQRHNSADLYNNGPTVKLDEERSFLITHANSNNYKVVEAAKTMYVQVHRSRSIQGFKSISGNVSETPTNMKLPPIFDDKEQKDINKNILKNLNLETSFDMGPKSMENSMINPKAHRENKSVKHINTPYNMNDLTLHKIKKHDPKKANLNLPFGSFSQSLGRFSSVQHFQHAHTDRDVMEEINEEMNESLDYFLLHDNYSKEFKLSTNLNYRRVETEVHKLNTSFSKSRLNDSKKEIDAISHSEADKMQDSFQHAHSDLFLESHKGKNDRNLPIIDLDYLDESDEDSSSSIIENSLMLNNSGNKTHDTIKAAAFHSPDARHFK